MFIVLKFHSYYFLKLDKSLHDLLTLDQKLKKYPIDQSAV